MVVGGLCTTLLGECKVADIIVVVEGGRAGGRSVGGSGAPLGGGVDGRVPAANIILTLICARNVHARVRLNVPYSMHVAAGHRRRAVGSEHVCAIAFLPRLNRLTVMRADCKPLHSTVSCCALNIDDDKRRRQTTMTTTTSRLIMQTCDIRKCRTTQNEITMHIRSLYQREREK